MLVLAGTGVGLATYLLLKTFGKPELFVKGTYVLEANPAFTDPPIPGMVYAIMQEGGPVFLTKDRNLLWENIPGIPVGTLVLATGEVYSKLDIYGEIVVLIEYDRIEPIS